MNAGVDLLLPGITATRVRTDRLTVNVLQIDGRDGIPVVLVHGNVSSALFWQQMMLDLPAGYRPIADGNYELSWGLDDGVLRLKGRPGDPVLGDALQELTW